jgi:HAD superfamily hydrolase (TIGR01450 family)
MNFQNPNTAALSDKKLYIFDMDGTIYLGYQVFPFAIRFINNLRAAGKKVLFFTNNASHTTDFYVNKLTKLGFSPTKEEIMTSGDVTIEFLKRHRAGKNVYLVGTDELVENFRENGIPMLTGKEENADIVVTSFDTTLTYDKLVKACDLIRNGAIYYCTHPDFNCPTENGFIPDSGAIAALVTASTGVTPRYFGKPYRETADMIAQKSEKPFSKIAVVGDRLYTDIALGKKHGILSVLVLSGETKIDDVTDENRADIIVDGIGDLIQYT